MTGEGELTAEQKAALKRMELEGERREALTQARVIGMRHAIEHLVRNSPLPIDLAYVQRHLGLDGREPEATAVRDALRTAWAPGGSLYIGEGHVIRAAT
jgi:hypothetical protein